jgi:hypothetical protein
MNIRTLAAALLLPLAALAQPAALLDITDPANDDDGDGTLVYPREGPVEPGDLDLRSLRVFADGADLRFEASFRNPIRDPGSARNDGPGGEDLSLFARRGFYAFNIDIYIDTDRVAGSGNTVTLPGRRARIAGANAWEKAVVLTPRPELMRRQLRDALGGTAEVDAGLDASVFFATQVRVRGRSVSFNVPKAFFGGANIGDAAITALVTAAKLTIESDLVTGLAGGNAFDRLTLGAQQPSAGRPSTGMGYNGDRLPATAVVDLLTPDPQAQALQLAAGAALQGLSRDNRYGLAPIPATPPAAAVTAAAAPWFTRAMAAAQAAGAPASAVAVAAPALAPAAAPLAAPAPAPAPAPVPAPVQAAVPAPVPAPARTVTPVPPPAAAAPLATAPAAPAKPRDAAFFEEQEQRLRTLKRLRDANLISEDEYQTKRREVLGAL